MRFRGLGLDATQGYTGGLMTPLYWVALVALSLVGTILAALLWSVRNPEPIDSDEWPLDEETS